MEIALQISDGQLGGKKDFGFSYIERNATKGGKVVEDWMNGKSIFDRSFGEKENVVCDKCVK